MARLFSLKGAVSASAYVEEDTALSKVQFLKNRYLLVFLRSSAISWCVFFVIFLHPNNTP